MADWKDTFPETAEETVADIYNKIKLPVRATAGVQDMISFHLWTLH